MSEPAYKYTTAAQLLEPSPNGRITLHQLAFGYSDWRSIDPSIITEKMLLTREYCGETAGEYWGETVAHRLAQSYGNFYLLPPHVVTPRVLMERDRHQNTVLHVLAGNFNFARFHLADNSRHPDPVSPVLTAEMLMVTNQDGDTVLHVMASGGLFNKKIKSLITPEMLMTLDRNGYTAIGRTADNGGSGIKAIAGLLTSDMLMERGINNRSVLFVAVRKRILHLIQPGLFRPEWMRWKFRGRPLLRILIEDYPKHTRRHIEEFDEKIRITLVSHILSA